MSECEGVGNVKEHGVDDVRGVRAAVRTHDFQPDRVGGAYHACKYKTDCNKKFVCFSWTRNPVISQVASPRLTYTTSATTR